MKTITTVEPYNILNKVKMSWKVVDSDHVEVIFYGRFDENYAGAERELNDAGLYAVRRTYNKKDHRTTTIYKRTRG